MTFVIEWLFGILAIRWEREDEEEDLRIWSILSNPVQSHILV